MLRIFGAAALMLLWVDATPAEAQSYPQVRDIGRGNTEVRVSRYCRILYDRRGRRELTSRECSSRDISYAGRLARDHRRDRYVSGEPGARPGPDIRFPYARTVAGGRTEVNVSRTCRVVYDTRGRPESSTPLCNRRDLERASDVYRDTRRRPAYDNERDDYRAGFDWLRGRDADDAEDALENRGYDRVDRWRPDYGGRYSIWWNRRERSCYRMYERDNRVRDIFQTDPRDCSG